MSLLIYYLKKLKNKLCTMYVLYNISVYLIFICHISFYCIYRHYMSQRHYIPIHHIMYVEYGNKTVLLLLSTAQWMYHNC